MSEYRRFVLFIWRVKYTATLLGSLFSHHTFRYDSDIYSGMDLHLHIYILTSLHFMSYDSPFHVIVSSMLRSASDIEKLLKHGNFHLIFLPACGAVSGPPPWRC
jgi:hypothetical protein